MPRKKNYELATYMLFVFPDEKEKAVATLREALEDHGINAEIIAKDFNIGGNHLQGIGIIGSQLFDEDTLGKALRETVQLMGSSLLSLEYPFVHEDQLASFLNDGELLTTVQRRIQSRNNELLYEKLVQAIGKLVPLDVAIGIADGIPSFYESDADSNFYIGNVRSNRFYEQISTALRASGFELERDYTVEGLPQPPVIKSNAAKTITIKSETFTKRPELIDRLAGYALRKQEESRAQWDGLALE
jgi:hypothetical protein